MPVSAAVEGDFGLNAVVFLDLTSEKNASHRLHTVEVCDIVEVGVEMFSERCAEHDAGRIRCIQCPMPSVCRKIKNSCIRKYNIVTTTLFL